MDLETQTLAAIVEPGAGQGETDEAVGFASAVHRWPIDPVAGDELVADLLDEGVEAVACVGSDRLLHEVISAYCRCGGHRGKGWRFWPIPAEKSLVAREVKAPQMSVEALDEEAVQAMDWSTHRLSTLKISASAAPAATYGFSFGAGWIYGAMETMQRARGGAKEALSALGEWTVESVGERAQRSSARRMTIDGRAVETNGPQGMVATVLQKSFFGLGTPSSTARLYRGLRRRELVRQAVTPTIMGGHGGEGEPFEQVVFDGLQRWVVDGHLEGYDEHGVVALSVGPTVSVAVPQQSLSARFGRWIKASRGSSDE